MVFRLDDDAYYVTNIDGLRENQAIPLKPFNRGIIRSFNEISKLFYFSGLLKNDLEPFADTAQRGDGKNGGKQEQAGNAQEADVFPAVRIKPCGE